MQRICSFPTLLTGLGIALFLGQPLAAATPLWELRALEKQAVRVSLENLMTFPFVRAALEDDMLTLHGLWNNTGEGALEQFDPAKDGFVPV